MPSGIQPPSTSPPRFSGPPGPLNLFWRPGSGQLGVIAGLAARLAPSARSSSI